MLDIHILMQSLSKRRLLFHSESDFQQALAWEIHSAIPDRMIWLEIDPFPEKRHPMFLDIWLPTEGIALELKYCTTKLDKEPFKLREQSARDVRRYDFLKDVQRLETVCAELNMCKAGYAVILTNDQGYWEKPRTLETMDADFRIHEGREITGNLGWHPRTGAGTMRDREAPIHLNGAYTTHWQDYSDVLAVRGGKFRYLVVAVQ